MVRQSRTPLNDVYEHLGKRDLGLPLTYRESIHLELLARITRDYSISSCVVGRSVDRV